MRKRLATIAVTIICSFGVLAAIAQPASAGGGSPVVDLSQVPAYVPLNHLAAKACNASTASRSYLNTEAKYTAQANAYNGSLAAGETPVPGWYFAVSQVCHTPLG